MRSSLAGFAALCPLYHQKGGNTHMRKFLLMLLACTLLCSLSASALANSWGLRGGVYDIVSDDDEYNSYTAEAETGNTQVDGRHYDVALMTSRYHNQLIAAVRENKVWRAETVSTTAVYQPGDKRGASPELSSTEGGFCLTYNDRERYLFDYVDGRYVLREVRFDMDSEYGDSLLWDGDGYIFWQSGPEGVLQPIGDAKWHVDLISLEDFNITQIPRSLDDVRRMGSVYEALWHAADTLSVHEDWHGVKNGKKLAVYSAPDTDSYRASSGKASVSTGGSMKLYGEIDGWTMVEYEVSLRTSRIGFVKTQLHKRYVGLQLAQPGVELVTARNAFLTDDPHVSQFSQLFLPAGTKVQGLALLSDVYALVRYEGGHQPVWGFLPLRDLDLPSDGTRWDVMEWMIGKWHQQGGADQGANLRVLFNDGSCRLVNKDADFNWLYDQYGTWRVTDCPAGAAYAEDVLYEITFTMCDGTGATYGLALEYDGTITLLTEDGSAWYERSEYSTFGNG